MPLPALPLTPQTQVSHMRSSREEPTASAQKATRSIQQAETEERLATAPASQESLTSVRTAGSSVESRLENNSGNVSQVTSYTNRTSPASSASTRARDQHTATRPEPLQIGKTHTAYEHAADDNDFAVTSPMSITSPTSINGSKRTASGHIKSAPSLPNTPMTGMFVSRHSRTGSISSTGSRAGDLASTLKTRLGYAMAKVQNGWEHKDINEVEHLAAYRSNPHRHSMSHMDYTRRPTSNGYTNGTGHTAMYNPYRSNGTTALPSSKRHSGTYASFAPSSQPLPRLQPAPDIRPTTSYQRAHHTARSSSQISNATSSPRTPTHTHSHRPPTIRTETQTAEAERDALQALFQLGSPHSSQPQMLRLHSQTSTSSSQASPLREEFATPRKVTFARSESGSSSAGGAAFSEDGGLEGARERGIEVL